MFKVGDEVIINDTCIVEVERGWQGKITKIDPNGRDILVDFEDKSGNYWYMDHSLTLVEAPAISSPTPSLGLTKEVLTYLAKVAAWLEDAPSDDEAFDCYGEVKVTWHGEPIGVFKDIDGWWEYFPGVAE